MSASNKTRRKLYIAPGVLTSQASKAQFARALLSLLVGITLLKTTESLPAAKMDTQLKWIINDAELLLQPQKPAQAEVAASHQATAGEPDEHFNLYHSELKRLSYETIHRILRDENEPIYRREDAEYRYYQKRSYQPRHEVVRRAVGVPETAKTAPVVVKQQGLAHTLKQSNAQLSTYDAARDYQGNHSTIYKLDLSNNQLQTVNLSAFTALQLVNLSNNSLTALPITQHEHTITMLNLNDNQIAQASEVHSSVLRELHLSGNEITQLAQLNLSMLTALETLDLSCNGVTELETAFFPQRMHNLKHLNLAHNSIGTIYRETFYNLLSLNTLLLSYNNISDIDYETFLALPNLQYLDLSHNQLRTEAIRALQGIPDLVRLSIAYNPEVGAAMQEFVASWSLKELDASGTGLCQIPAALAQSVRTFKLTDNWLKIINCGDLDSYPLLQYLDLSHSRIEDIEDDALGRLEILETLFLDHNRLRKVPSSLPTSVEHLFLHNNEIMDIQAQSFQGLNNLQTLDLSGNKLLYLPALPLPKLLTLNLRSAGLRGVSQAMVHTLPRLRDLLLDENPIKCSDLLSIAEWASPCRIVDRGGNRTALDGYNIEGNGVVDDFSGVVEEADDNRIGGGEQIISKTTSAAAADKLGQQQLVDDDAEGVSAASADRATAADIELKQKFVRMHNFFEKFRSNCGADRQMTADGGVKETAEIASVALTAAPPICAVEFDAGSSEQTAVESLARAERIRTNGVDVVSFNLKSEELLHAETPTLKAQQQESTEVKQKYLEAERAKALQANGSWTRKSKKDGKMSLRAETKLFKFNQKNFTAESSAELITAATTTTTSTKRAVGFDYNADAGIATTTTTTPPTTTTQTKKITSALPTASQRSKMFATKTAPSTIMEIVISKNNNNNINATSAGPKTLWQLTTVATANFLRQQISPTKTTTSAVNSSRMMNIETASARNEFATRTTTSYMPATMLAKEDMKEQLNKERKTTTTTATNVTTATNPIKFELLATASQNRRSQQQHANFAVKAAATTITTTITEATTGFGISKNSSTATTKAEKIPPTDSNATLTTTTAAITHTSAITTRKPTTYTILLPVRAKYLQMKGTPASSSSHLAPQAASTQDFATIKSINVEEASIFGLRKHGPPLNDQQLHENKITETKIPKVIDEIATTTPKNIQQLSTTATIANNSPAKPKVDNNIKQNNNKTEDHEEKAGKQYKPNTTKDHEAKGAAETEAAAAESLKHLATKPKAVTHFWQQHNFKRANPSPSDNFGRRPEPGYELETKGGQTKRTMEDVRITEHTLSSDTTTAESEHIPAPTIPPPSPPHKHEPLQLHIRDRHLIGTPLLMHRGDNMLVEATEALRQGAVTAKTITTIATAKPTTKTTISLAESQTTKGGHRTVGERGDEAQSHIFVNQIQAVEAMNRNIKLADEGQGKFGTSTNTAAIESSTETTTDVPYKAQLQPKTGVGSRSGENMLATKAVMRKHDDIAGGGNSGKRKPSLIMKKMTIQTKHTQQTQMPHHHTLNTPRENEVMQGSHNEARSNDARDALTGKLLKADSEWHNNGEEAAALAQPQHKHSTVNTPIIRDRNNHAHLLATLTQAHAEHAPDAPKAQHSISNQHSADHSALQLQELAALHTTQTQKWLGTRHEDASSAHPALFILLSFSLLALLLVGLMHVYRCDVLPWHRHLLAHQQRPHLQRQFNSAVGDDDVHSFLQYHNNGAGQQQQHQQQQKSAPPRWHHGTRSRADFSSPLHNLHVRELQKTSAVEAEAATRITRSYYDVQPYAKSARRNGSTASSASGGSADISRHSSSSLSSTHSSCSAAAGMLDADDTFHVEMAAECAQMGDAIHCDILPMELLTAATAYQRDVEREADTAVHETESLTLGGGKQAAQSVRTAIDSDKACGKQSATPTAATKLQQWRSSNSTLFNNKNGRSKRGAKAVGVSSSSSSSATSRKFDLW